jgi:hypothetical protein
MLKKASLSTWKARLFCWLNFLFRNTKAFIKKVTSSEIDQSA